MQIPDVEKLECPSCGQHYSIEVTDSQQDVTCQVCNAVFTVDNRNAFLKGLEKTLKSRAKAAKDDPEGTPEVKRTTGLYMTAFSSAESRYESDRQKAKTTRLFALGAVFVSCFMLFMMLVIPALLRIEENTRRG